MPEIKGKFEKSTELILETEFLNEVNYQIDLCKIDIEGNEMKSFLGMGEKITNIKIIQFEFGPASIDSKTFFKDFYLFFSKLKFKIYQITPSRLQRINYYDISNENFRVANFVVINDNNFS